MTLSFCYFVKRSLIDAYLHNCFLRIQEDKCTCMSYHPLRTSRHSYMDLEGICCWLSNKCCGSHSKWVKLKQQLNCNVWWCKFNWQLLQLTSRSLWTFYLNKVLRLVFTSNGVGVVVRVVRTLMTYWKSKIRVLSGVLSSTESKWEESERFHFDRFRLRLRRLWSGDYESRKQKGKIQQITRPGIEHCDWFVLSLLLSTTTN